MPLAAATSDRPVPDSPASPWAAPASPWPAPPRAGERGDGREGRTGRPPAPDRPPFPAAAWLAVLGAILLLVGAAAFTASRWDLLPGGVKLGLLWGATGAVLALGAQLRPRLPLSGAALFHVGVLLVPVSASATALGLGSAWPGALLAAGCAGAPVAWILGWRRAAPVLCASAIVLVGVALAGMSALGAGPLGVLLAGAALLTAVGGVADHDATPRRARWTDAAALVWAGAAAIAPVTGWLVSERVGTGTAARLGLLGAQLGWAAPLGGVLAAGALVVVSRRRQPVVLGLAAVASATFGLLVGLEALEVDEFVWLCLPSIAILVAQVAAYATAGNRRWAGVTRVIADGAAAMTAAALVVVWLPAATVVATYGIGQQWVLPTVLAALASLACGVRDRKEVAARAAALGTGPWTALAAMAAGLPGWAAALVVALASAVVWAVRTQPRGFARLPEWLAGGVAIFAVAAAQPAWWSALRDAGVLESDLAVAIVAGGWALGGAWVRSRDPEVRTWVTSGPAIGLLGGQLLAMFADTGELWRGLAALVLGVVAVAVGGWRQQSAPLVLGTAITIGAVLLLAGDGLAAVPVWAWLVAAGALLLGLAVVMERRGGGVAATREVVDTVLRRYR